MLPAFLPTCPARRDAWRKRPARGPEHKCAVVVESLTLELGAVHLGSRGTQLRPRTLPGLMAWGSP